MNCARPFSENLLTSTQKKESSNKLRSGIYANVVTMKYQTEDRKMCEIRVSKNSSIIIVSAPFGTENLGEIILNKIIF